MSLKDSNIISFFKKYNTAILCLVLLIFVYSVNLASPHFIDDLINKVLEDDFLNPIYVAIQSSGILKAVSCICWIALLIVVYCTCYSSNQRIFGLAVVMFLAAGYFQFDLFWGYAVVIGPISFREFLSVTAFVCGIVSSYKFYQLHQSSKESDHDDNEEDNQEGQTHENTFMREYATRIINQIKESRSRQTSFAIGIQGEWGSGKTTFLSEINSQLRNELVLEFNPWRSQNFESIIQDFFSQLSKSIHDNVSEDVLTLIKKYADTLVQTSDSNWTRGYLSSFFNGDKDRNNAELYEDIASELENLDEQIYVLIDDLDRLEGKEIFEVLRLIRNTAGFPNIAYIVTYDKDYITSLLKSNNIARADEYLEKIFDYEIGLPKRLNKELEGVLISDIEFFCPNGTLDEIKNLITNDRRIVESLANFRRIHRFARQFATIHNLMLDRLGETEFDAKDLFLVELLHYNTPKSYETLKYYPTKIINSSDSDFGIRRAIVKLETELPKEVESGLYWILDLLFSAERAVTSESIPLVYNFNKYFRFQPNEKYIDSSVIPSWLSKEDSIEEARESLNAILEAPRKPIDVLLRFSVVASPIIEANLERYLKGLFIMLNEFIGIKWLKELVSNQLFATVTKVINQVNTDIIKTTFEYEIANASLMMMLEISAILNRLKDKNSDYVSTFMDIEKTLMKAFLHKYSPDPSEIINDKSAYSTIYKNALHKYYTEYADGPFYDPHVLDIVLEYFSQKKSSKRKQFLEPLYGYYSTDADGEYWYEYPPEMIDDQIAFLFGTNENFEKYRDNCFD